MFFSSSRTGLPLECWVVAIRSGRRCETKIFYGISIWDSFEVWYKKCRNLKNINCRPTPLRRKRKASNENFFGRNFPMEVFTTKNWDKKVKWEEKFVPMKRLDDVFGSSQIDTYKTKQNPMRKKRKTIYFSILASNRWIFNFYLILYFQFLCSSCFGYVWNGKTKLCQQITVL